MNREPSENQVRELLARYGKATEASPFEVERLKRRALRPREAVPSRFGAWALGWSGAIVAVGVAAFLLRPPPPEAPTMIVGAAADDAGPPAEAPEGSSPDPRRSAVRGSAIVLASRDVDSAALVEARDRLALAAVSCGQGEAEISTDRFGAIVHIETGADVERARCLSRSLAGLVLPGERARRAGADSRGGWVQIRFQRREAGR